jgi:hypothetical protein
MIRDDAVYLKEIIGAASQPGTILKLLQILIAELADYI